MIFPEALAELGQYKSFAEALGVPILSNIFEQRATGRLIRPTAEYIGPEPRTFIAVDQR